MILREKNENSNKETSKKIEPIVTVYSVDGGIIQGKYVCQNGNMLAYKDGAGIYLSKDGSEAKKVAEINGVKSISVNSQHVFCLKKSNSIDVIDLDTNDDGFEKKESLLICRMEIMIYQNILQLLVMIYMLMMG